MNDSYVEADADEVLKRAEDIISKIYAERELLKKNSIEEVKQSSAAWRKIFVIPWILECLNLMQPLSDEEANRNFSLTQNLRSLRYGNQLDVCLKLQRLAKASSDGKILISGFDLTFIEAV